MVVGYGLTESTATVSCTLPVGYDIGSVGVVLPGIEVKIGEDSKKSYPPYKYEIEMLKQEQFDPQMKEKILEDNQK